MLAKSAAAVALLLASFVAAQNSSTPSLDPNSVPTSTKSQWCAGEISTCGTLCSGNVDANDCDPTTLVFNCTCTANHSAPGLQYYEQTMPTFICEQVFQNCIVAGQNDAAAQTVCKTNEAKDCGHLNPANFTPPAATTSSATTSPTASSTTAGTSAQTSKAVAASLMVGRDFGTGLIAAAAAAAFGFLL